MATIDPAVPAYTARIAITATATAIAACRGVASERFAVGNGNSASGFTIRCGEGCGARLSAEAANDERPDRICDWHGQLAPKSDEGAVLGVERVVLWNALALEEHELVVQRRRLEAPVLLEVERAGAALAAAVVEELVAPLAGATHQLPVLEVVC